MMFFKPSFVKIIIAVCLIAVIRILAPLLVLVGQGELVMGIGFASILWLPSYYTQVTGDSTYASTGGLLFYVLLLLGLLIEIFAFYLISCIIVYLYVKLKKQKKK
jgi:hypothetical protein